MIEKPKLPLDPRLLPYKNLMFNNYPLHKRVVRKMAEIAEQQDLTEEEIKSTLHEHSIQQAELLHDLDELQKKYYLKKSFKQLYGKEEVDE